ncbi:MAG: metallophosphoesterase, partial [Acidimicrobiia bacterium]|nr:metallophosphoesterase [Acidimicrobiia bacterium]
RVRNPLAPSALQVWAAEDTSVQLTWGTLPAGRVAIEAGGRRIAVEHPGGPGSIELGELEPATRYRIDVRFPGGHDRLAATTLAPPPGRALSRIATISDLHLGSTNWGASKLMTDRSGDDVPFPTRCARAAITEAIEWGAELLVVKGDAAHHQDPDHFHEVGRLLDAFDELPVLLIPGNHEVDGRCDIPVPAKVGERGIPYVRGAACEDLMGLRVIVADTTVPGLGTGSLDRVGADVVDLAAVSPGPYLLGIHHQLQPGRLPTHYPLGIAGPASTDFLDELAMANDRGLVTSGHTHRNRTRRHGPLVLTEVASVRDWPGVWAGYAVHEGGIRQVIRRAAAPEAMAWHEYSRRALLGGWGRWAIGSLEQRCFTHPWP